MIANKEAHRLLQYHASAQQAPRGAGTVQAAGAFQADAFLRTPGVATPPIAAQPTSQPKWLTAFTRAMDEISRFAASIGQPARPTTSTPAPSVPVATPPKPAQPDHEAFVKGLYQELLGREADPQGLASFVNGLNNGLSRDQVRQIFLTSPEYQNRLNALLQPPAAPPATPAPTEQPAAPAPAFGGPPGDKVAPAPSKADSVGPVPLEGYDHGKLHNMSHRTTKYLFGRIASHFPLDQVKDHAAADALLKRMRPEMEAAGLKILDVNRDKILVVTEIGPEWVDVVRGAGSGNPGWWWGSEGKRAEGVAWDGRAPNYGAPGSTPAPAPATPAPAPGGDIYAAAPVDRSSEHAAILSAARWVKDTRPDLFANAGDRAVCVQIMGEVIKALRAHGFEAYRIVNHPSLPKSNPVRWGSDALILNGICYDVYRGIGEANEPQVLVHGPTDKAGEWEG